MNNRDVAEARRYHELTKRSYQSVRQSAHYLDWDNRPALYPIIEVYLVSTDSDGLEAGLYHFNPGDFALTRLRSGDWAEQAAGKDAIFVVTLGKSAKGAKS